MEFQLGVTEAGEEPGKLGPRGDHVPQEEEEVPTLSVSGTECRVGLRPEGKHLLRIHVVERVLPTCLLPATPQKGLIF